MFGMAAGLAHLGFVPFPSTFGAFAARKALDQIYMHICCQKLNVKIPGSYIGMTATECGPSQNVGEDIAVMRAMPYMRVIAPGDNLELRSAMHVMMEYDGPVYFRVPRSKLPYCLIPITGLNGEKVFCLEKVKIYHLSVRE